MKVKPNHTWWLVIFILVLALVFRTYNFEKSFLFNHDQDLYSWIAKDILVNGHQRLVGQVTSVDGVFIGSFYYYLMAAVYKLFGWSPLSAYFLVTAVGMFDTWSIYWVCKRHWGRRTALMTSFIYAVSFGVAEYERWSVPTQLTMAWSIWFLATILELLKGHAKWAILYGLLVGFVWQLHIALLPILPLPLLAYLTTIKFNLRNFPRKMGLLALTIMMLTSLPFIVFEVKHDFSQVRSMITASGKDIGAPTGWQKFSKTVDASGRELQKRLVFGWEIEQVQYLWWGLAVISGWLVVKRITDRRLVGIAWLWLGITFGVQFLSKRMVSEYYFSNIIPVCIVLVGIFLGSVRRWWWLALLVYFGSNLWWLVTKSDNDGSYYYKKMIVEEVVTDVGEKRYPCVAINFITDPGVGVGFRYLFWERGVKLVKTTAKNVPVYNILVPWQVSEEEGPRHYGRFGVLLPETTMIDQTECLKPENELEWLLGYTE